MGGSLFLHRTFRMLRIELDGDARAAGEESEVSFSGALLISKDREVMPEFAGVLYAIDDVEVREGGVWEVAYGVLQTVALDGGLGEHPGSGAPQKKVPEHLVADPTANPKRKGDVDHCGRKG